jgi:UPF0176 protein
MIQNLAAYRFVAIDDPDALCRTLHASAAAHALLGTVLVAVEGINLFLAGEPGAVHAFVEDLRADARFTSIDAKFSTSAVQPFLRLKAKVKPEIISFRREGASPLAQRAPAVTPAVLARWIERGADDAGRRVVLLDTRNREEVRHGSFRGAVTLPIDTFTELPAALAPLCDDWTDATVVSFCTGGVRCEKAALWMRAAGVHDVLQLDGGILGYFEHVGGFGYEGACFVFDQRVAVGPDLLPVVSTA